MAIETSGPDTGRPNDYPPPKSTFNDRYQTDIDPFTGAVYTFDREKDTPEKSLEVPLFFES